jgi:hypothetical protein
MFTLVACNNDDKTPDETPDTTCTEHVDADTNGKCDKCGADVAVQPEEKPDDKPVEPQVDVTKDVPNAVKLLNSLMNSKVETTPDVEDTVKILLTLSNASITGNLVDTEGATFPVKSVAVDGDLIKVVAEVDGAEVEAYVVATENGMYCVTTDGETYDYSFESFDTVEFENETVLPELTEDDIVYDEVTGYFVIKDTYITKVMAVLMPEGEDGETDVSLDEMIGMPGLDDTLDAMKYEIKFKISEDNVISELNIKGVVTQNEIRNEILAVVVKNGNDGFSFTATINYLVNISMNVKYEVFDDNTGKFSASLSMIPPMGMGMESQNFNFSIDVALSESTIVVSDELKTHLDKAAALFDKLPEIQTKYNGIYNGVDVECEKIAVYDDEYQVYIVLAYDWDGYVYDSIVINIDDETCIGTLSDGVIAVTEHSVYEQAAAEAAAKYDGVFTSEVVCDTIAVWDELIGQYAVFEMDFFNDGEYEFVGIMDEPWGLYCVGTVDVTNKVLTVIEHNSVEVFVDSIKDKEFTLSGDTTCENVYVEYEDYYIFFYKNSNGSWGYCGSSNWAPSGCEAIIDTVNNTLVIVEHSH